MYLEIKHCVAFSVLLGGSVVTAEGLHGVEVGKEVPNWADPNRAGFLRDVAMVAKESGLVESDAYQVPIPSFVQLSDEEILAQNPELAAFFEMIEDDEKYAKWEKEEMPGILLEIEATKKRGSKKTKKWARKATAASEITTCNRVNYWKSAAYSACRRWGNSWYNWWQCQRWGCYGDDNEVLGLCHKSCHGWRDDGTRCWKTCTSQSTTPVDCAGTMCSETSSSCFWAVVDQVVSIASMLASVFPVGKVAALAGKLAKAASRAAAKALLKAFAKSIVKSLVKKVKRKVKKFMKSTIKNQVKQLKDAAVEEILQEAAEAFAIERTKQEMEHTYPSVKEVAAAIDPIGVMDVIAAFDKPTCDNTVIDTFPSCPSAGQRYISSSMSYAILQADDNCCFGYSSPQYVSYNFYWFRYHVWEVKCLADESQHLKLSVTENDGDDLFDYDDDGDANYAPEELADVLYQDPIFASDQVLFCQLCGMHSTCQDNEIEGANLTAFDECTAEGCCGDAPEGFPIEAASDDEGGPDADAAVASYSKHASTLVKVEVDQDEGNDCSVCDMISLCESPSLYEWCDGMGCCEGLEDPSSDNWVPGPLPNSTNPPDSPSN